MTTPVFVTFTAMDGTTIPLSTTAGVAYVEPFTAAQGKPGSIETASLVVFSNGASVAVSGSVADTYAALGVSLVGPGVLCNTPQGTVALASYGTDAVSTADTYYWSEGFNPTTRTVTNVACLNGTTAATDKAIYAIWDADGAVLGWTALAGVLCANGDTFQSIALVTPITIPAGRYFVGFVVNGTTTAHQTIAASTYPNYTGTTAGTFGAAVPAITPTTSTTAGVGPFWRLS
jgi:hypothetical protein